MLKAKIEEQSKELNTRQEIMEKLETENYQLKQKFGKKQHEEEKSLHPNS
jgi:hypothetical protein